MYGNDPEIFSISIMEKVPEIWNSGTIFFCKPEIFGTLFWNYGTLWNSVPENSSLQNSVPENSDLRNNFSWIFQKKVPENVEDILNLCKRYLYVFKVILLWIIMT